MIELQRIHKRRGQFHLQIEELTINPGVTLLVGKNGAGKTTLLQLLATAANPDSGVITYAGKQADTHLALIRSEVGYVPTEIELYGEMTVRQILRYLGELKGLSETEIKRETESLITSFQLTNVEESKIRHLADGNKRRVSIAQAFLGKPAFLFLDEPLNNLDIAEQKRVTTSLYHYAAKRAVVVSTHELNVWEYQCDHIVWLHNGSVHFYGSPVEWVTHPYLNVWKGTVHNQELGHWLKNYRVVQAQQQDDGRQHVRIIAAESPGEHFTPVQANLEEGFFFRSE